MRLIDADELRKTMYHKAFETNTNMQKWDSGCWIRYKMFENALENAPTIKVEPVIRCKDCKYFHDYGDGVKNCWGDGGGMKDDDYCSQAKRKDE